mmetsp:Transcript_34600/g.62285  ORF Transcript_34600/g.62285 Transcript_34600/m.62285 type:complete len:92 (+) Transcript_34600:43-318(+)
MVTHLLKQSVGSKGSPHRLHDIGKKHLRANGCYLCNQRGPSYSLQADEYHIVVMHNDNEEEEICTQAMCEGQLGSQGGLWHCSYPGRHTGI